MFLFSCPRSYASLFLSFSVSASSAFSISARIFAACAGLLCATIAYSSSLRFLRAGASSTHRSYGVFDTITAAAVISVHHLTKTFGDGDLAVHAVTSVDLDIGAGEVVLVMGPSGSGKTTLLLMLGAMLRPTSGSVLVDGLLEGTTVSLKPDHFGSANAIGAAIAQVSGEVDSVVSLEGTTREIALESVVAEARARADDRLAGDAAPHRGRRRSAGRRRRQLRRL